VHAALLCVTVRSRISLWAALENFVVGFRIMSYSGLSGADHEAIPRGFDNSSLDDSKVIHTENSLDLSEKSSQEPKVSSGHPNKARSGFRNELFVREDDAGREERKDRHFPFAHLAFCAAAILARPSALIFLRFRGLGAATGFELMGRPRFGVVV
jgi:hypothetical protein